MSPSDRPIPFPGTSVGSTDSADVATDTRLLAELAAGQAGALAELYRRRGGPLLGMLERMLNDNHEAEEVLQDTFVRLWRRAGEYNAAKAGPLTWMVMIARGLALDRLRHRSRQAANFDGYRQTLDPAEVDADFVRRIEEEPAGRVSQALAKLPLEQREAIELVFWRGCTQEEISRATGAPLGTIKARIRRGMLGLRHLLKERHG
ncbi:MAG TPA: sigma-70 family RNA polymerase sigma factor [Verrucomicrobiota bacterium]|nr:RNA polymerase subunit sigma [Verrucomicrobiales bacterium]HRI16411.1 sigma-70 family RNA polymerase sigma factor [Verrucomicrobiota bacterium]